MVAVTITFPPPLITQMVTAALSGYLTRLIFILPGHEYLAQTNGSRPDVPFEFDVATYMNKLIDLGLGGLYMALRFSVTSLRFERHVSPMRATLPSQTGSLTMFIMLLPWTGHTLPSCHPGRERLIRAVTRAAVARVVTTMCTSGITSLVPVPADAGRNCPSQSCRHMLRPQCLIQMTMTKTLRFLKALRSMDLH